MDAKVAKNGQTLEFLDGFEVAYELKHNSWLFSLPKVPKLCLDERRHLFNNGETKYPRTSMLPRHGTIKKKLCLLRS
jgi:hypothetical protein